MKLKTFLCGIMLAILLPMASYGERTEPFLVNLSGAPDPDDMDPQHTKKRSRGQQIPCEITMEGILISGMDATGISLYEVYDINGDQIASFESEQEFISYLFVVEEDVEIRLSLDGIELRGYLYQ